MRVKSLAARTARTATLALVLFGLMAAPQAGDFEGVVSLSTASPNSRVREMIRAYEAHERGANYWVTSFWDPDQRPVYLLTPVCCDQLHGLYDRDGRYICAPSGGLSGSGDGKCLPWAQMSALQRRLRLPATQPTQHPQAPEPSR